jgi:hypothetical protein
MGQYCSFFLLQFVGYVEAVWGGSCFDQSRMEYLGSPLYVWCIQLINWTTAPSAHSPHQLPMRWKTPFKATATTFQLPLTNFPYSVTWGDPEFLCRRNVFLLFFCPRKLAQECLENGGFRESAILHWYLLLITQPFGLHARGFWYPSARK